MEDIIASRKLIGLDINGREFSINIQLGRPHQEAEHEWRCPVRVDGLHSETMLIEDMDSFAVINQAIGLAYHYLENFEAAGGKLLWTFNRQPTSTKEELF